MPGDKQPFPAGVSANPGGRPKKTDDMRRAEDLLRSRSEQGAKDLIELSEKSPDDQVRAKLLIYRHDRVFGKPVAAVEISGPDGDPLIDWSRLTDDQLRALVTIGRAATPGTGDDPSGGGGTPAT